VLVAWALVSAEVRAERAHEAAMERWRNSVADERSAL
jgi:hypothetical protein